MVVTFVDSCCLVWVKRQAMRRYTLVIRAQQLVGSRCEHEVPVVVPDQIGSKRLISINRNAWIFPCSNKYLFWTHGNFLNFGSDSLSGDPGAVCEEAFSVLCITLAIG